jgi:phosphatidylglycerol:prolipoprotein diacylglycerol transferase
LPFLGVLVFPTLIRIGDFQLATYGIFVAAGYMAGILWLSARHKRMGLSESQFWGLIYALFFGAVMGGKVLFWLVEWRDLVSGDLRLIRDFRFGFVFYGGLLGAALMGVWYRRREPFSYLKVADYFSVAIPIGHAIGRLGCFAAGCCAGLPTTLPWGVRFTHPGALVARYLHGVPLHPTQLYETAINLVIAFVTWRTLTRVQQTKSPVGTAALTYVAAYAAARFLLEFLRGDNRGGFFLYLSPSQWIALACAATAVWALPRLKRVRT